MTAKDNICEVCGNVDEKGNVCSSGIAPMSMYICRPCLIVKAEPVWLVDGVGGDIAVPIYDPEFDQYFWNDDVELVVMTNHKTGKKFSKREEIMKEIENEI